MMFYIWIIFAIKDLKSVTPRRYIDWSITTSVMLFTTIVFDSKLNSKIFLEDQDLHLLH
jgi:hypothetical protein